MYHYTECGLKNVWLTNGYQVCEFDGEKAVSITDAEQLHEVIGRTLAAKCTLSAAEIRFLRKELGLSQKRLADLLGSTEQTVSLWVRRGRTPTGYDRLIRLLYLENYATQIATPKTMLNNKIGL
jgi:putative transcriptional regulator